MNQFKFIQNLSIISYTNNGSDRYINIVLKNKQKMLILNGIIIIL